jgi:hypothetical protein
MPGADRPAFLQRFVAEEALDGVDAHGLVDVFAVARFLARVVADPPVNRGEGIVADDDLPGLPIPAGLRFGEPRLNVLAGRARAVAWRQAIDVARPHRADRRQTVHRIARVVVRCHSVCS